MAGSADPTCTTCHGRGIYWDRPGTEFVGLLTFIHAVTSGDEQGVVMSPTEGVVNHGEPLISIPANAPGGIWEYAALEDAYVELDSIIRWRTTLKVGVQTQLPYQNNLSVASSGAVTLYNQSTKSSEIVNSYSVSGGSVILSGYPKGTPYTVEYLASPVYIAWRKSGGMPHVRPFGSGIVNLPKRFKLVQLDLWLRTKFGGVSPNSL